MDGKAGQRAGRRSLALVGALITLAGCGQASGTNAAAGGRVEVVAAENFWGSIVGQLGGDHVHVANLVVNPATDPHSYEATPADARAIARAQYVVINGAGYDAWAPKLLAANPVAGRETLTVGDLVGRREGDNPHLWYSPTYVTRVVDRVTADLEKIDASDTTYFQARNSAFKGVALKDYTRTIGAIKAKYAGVPVGATESIFAYTAEATGLRLVTPAGYMKAVSEGTDVSAADKVTVAAQVGGRQVKVLVFNSQNTTPDVAATVATARSLHIPVVAVTETLAPPDATFQDWQTSQLEALLAALGG